MRFTIRGGDFTVFALLFIWVRLVRQFPLDPGRHFSMPRSPSRPVRLKRTGAESCAQRMERVGR